MTKALPAKFVKNITGIIRKNASAVQYGPIGIDFSANSLRMVQFRKNEHAIELHAAAKISITSEQLDSARYLRPVIKQCLKKNGFVGREIVTCLQPEDVKIMMLSYMHQPDKTDEELIIKRIAERIDDGIENYVIDFMMVRPDVAHGQERSVLVALAEHEKVVDRLEYLRKAGLAVKVLEIEPTAIRRLISTKDGHDHNTNLMTISMGDSQTYITVLSGRRLIYERDIDFGEIQLIAMLCKELEIDEHEARTMLVRGNSDIATNATGDGQNLPVTDAFYSVLKPLFMGLVEDINRALIYAASETRGMPVKHVYLTNRVATWYGIENFINTLIEVPVSVLTSFDGFKNAEEFDADLGPRGAVVSGMALYALTE